MAGIYSHFSFTILSIDFEIVFVIDVDIAKYSPESNIVLIDHFETPLKSGHCALKIRHLPNFIQII